MKNKLDRTIRKAGEKRRRRQTVVGLIPARGGSKGLKRKNLKYVGGYPLVGLSVLTMRAAGIRPTYVSTEDKEIMQVAQTYGGLIVERPKSLAEDRIPTEPVIRHFLNKVECDIVVMVQCTSPLLEAGDIKRGLDKLLAFGLDSVFSAVACDDLLLWDRNLRPINYNPKRRGRRQIRDTCAYIETGGFFIFTREMFLSENCRIGGRFDVCEVPFWQSFQVDNKHDLKRIKKLKEKI